MAQPGSNGLSAMDRWGIEIEKHMAAKIDIMMRAMRECQPIQKMIRDAKAAAKNEGVSAKQLNAFVKARGHLAKAAAALGGLEEDDSDAVADAMQNMSPIAGQ